MSDKDLKQFFTDLKKKEALTTPDFNELFGKAKAKAKPPTKRSGKLFSINRIAVAASLLLLISLGVWQLKQNMQTTTTLEDEFAMRWIEEETIMDWESSTDELLPTEISTNENEIEFESIEIREVTEEVIQEVIAETELDSSLYEYGAISDWESPTASLMPPTMGMGLSF